MKIALDRAKAGTVADVVERVWDRLDAGLDWSDALTEEVVDQTVARYSRHIAAALRRYGFAVEDGEVITAAVLLRCINERTGLAIEHLTPGGVSVAVDRFVSGRMSDMLGVDIASINDIDALKASLIAGAVDAVQSGRATRLVPRSMMRKIRERKAWVAGGVPVEDRQKMLNRWYQKKFRRTHKGVWREKGDVRPGAPDPWPVLG